MGGKRKQKEEVVVIHRQPPTVDFSLSLADLLFVDGFKEAYQDNDVEAMNVIMYKNGMDVYRDVEKVWNTHRTLAGFVVTAYRWEGFERHDEKWLKSGAASLDVQIAAIEDRNLRHTLRQYKQDKRIHGIGEGAEG